MTVKIAINGPIISSEEKWIYDYFEEEATCARDVSSKLPSNNEDVEVTINSYGGYVDQGAEIYTILRAYPGNVIVNVVAAYSAASVIAMAGNITRISPVGRMMIHNASAANFGDFHDMDKMSEILQNANDSMSNAYMQKTGKSKEEILGLMDGERWLTAEEAIDLGFADELMFAEIDQIRLVASAGQGTLPANVINKVKDLKQKNLLTEKVSMSKEAVECSEIEKIVNTAINELKETTIIQGKSLQEWVADSEVPVETKQKSLFEKMRKGV